MFESCDWLIMINGSDCLQIRGGGLQLVRGSIQEYVVSCGTITHHFNPSIQFEQTVSNTNIPFLDVNIIFENSRLTTDLYSKPTDKHQYLHYSSCHPKHTKTSLPYSLATETMLQRNSLSKAHRRNAKPPPTTGIQERMHERCHKKSNIHTERRCTQRKQ